MIILISFLLNKQAAKRQIIYCDNCDFAHLRGKRFCSYVVVWEVTSSMTPHKLSLQRDDRMIFFSSI